MGARAAPLPGVPVLLFCGCRLVEGQGLFDAEGRPVRLGEPALAILGRLVALQGAVAPHRELIEAGWGAAGASDSTLRVTIAALRRLLGEGPEAGRVIVNVPGRGYSFVAPVTEERAFADPPPAQPGPPLRLTRLVGREADLSRLARALAERRIVTLVGPGGIGKTSLATDLAAGLAGGRQLVFVDLAPLADGAALAATVAAAYGLQLPPQDPVAGLAAYVGARDDLLILDNCEHLVDAAAGFVEAILAATPALAILATSREPLRCAGERLYRLAPLEVPEDGAPPEAVRRASAVRLFLERAAPLVEDFDPSPDDLAAIAALCRTLEGVPLAIEMAAANVAVFGIDGLASALGDTFLTIAGGRRTALPRHRTMEAVLDWSHALLTPAEQRLYARLAVFRGGFDEAAALAVGTGDGSAGDGREAVQEQLAALAAKSLLAADLGGDRVIYRMPMLTRVHAAARLEASGLGPGTRRRHAAHYRDHLAAAFEDWRQEHRAAWIARHGPIVDDVRAALDWAWGPEGDLTLGLELAAGFVHLGYQLWLVAELRERTARALDTYPFRTDPRPIEEVRLCLALGHLTQQMGGSSQLMQDMMARALDIADQTGLPKLQLGALASGWAACYGQGDYPGAERFARRLTLVGEAIGDGGSRAVAMRMMAQSLHHVGSHDRAAALADTLLADRLTQPRDWTPFPMHHRISMGIIKSRILWLRGLADQALDLALETARVSHDEMVFAVCHAYAMGAMPVLLWRGDDALAARTNLRLVEHCRRYSTGMWVSWAAHFAQVLKRRGLPEQSRPGFLPEPGPPGAMLGETLATFDAHFLGPIAVTRVQQGAVGWCAPEVLRLHALRLPAPDAAPVLERALALARRDGVPAWELRIAMTLARQALEREDPAAARAALEPVLAGFTEGHGTADLKQAAALMDEIG